MFLVVSSRTACWFDDVYVLSQKQLDDLVTGYVIDVFRLDKDSKDDDAGYFGPALPPGFKKQQTSPER